MAISDARRNSGCRRSLAKPSRGIRTGKYRSRWESRVALQLRRVAHEFEPRDKIIPYKLEHTYLPDFILESGIILEAKGVFSPRDRAKHIAIKAQHPDMDIRIVFQNSEVKISKKSRTTYGEWCSKHDIQWCHRLIPDAWLQPQK